MVMKHGDIKKEINASKAKGQERIDTLEEQHIFYELKIKVLELLAQRNPDRNQATELLVNEILMNKKIFTTRDDDNEEVWIYKDGIYIPQGKTYIRELMRLILNEVYSTQLYNTVLAKIEADTYVDAYKFFNTNYLWEIPVQNGILNLKTRELTEFTSDKIFFNKLPMEYNPSAKCPNIQKHFETTLNKNDIIVMEEIFGSLLLKEYRIEKAVMMLGFGRNGKSKTLELMKRFVGPDNCSAVPLQNMKPDNFRLAELFGKLVNLSGDLSNTSLKDTGCLKGLLGRDLMSGDRKFKTNVNFINYAKIIFAANELPRVYDSSDGFWDKWILLTFPYKFVTQEEYNNLEEKENHKIIDPDHIEKISNVDELSGLLNLALDGLDRLNQNNNFSYSVTGKEIREFWIRKSDSFAAFCMDCLEQNNEGFITKKELRRYYTKYCKALKLVGVGPKSMKITLENEFGCIESNKFMEDTTSDSFLKVQLPIWEGVKFREDIKVFLKNLENNLNYGDYEGISTPKRILKFSIDSKNPNNLLNLQKTEIEDTYMSITNIKPMLQNGTELPVSGLSISGLTEQETKILLANDMIIKSGTEASTGGIF